jgi:hypothetical protein
VTKQAAFNPFAQYEVNEDLETAGVWLVDPFHRMRVARAGGRNTKFNTVYEALTKPYKRAIQTKTLPKEIDLELSRELYAKAVITGWSVAEIDNSGKKPMPKRGEDGEIIWHDGKMFDPVTFEIIDVSVEKIVETFRVKPELYSYVVERANDVTTFRDEDADEADVGNS